MIINQSTENIFFVFVTEEFNKGSIATKINYRYSKLQLIIAVEYQILILILINKKKKCIYCYWT